MAGYSRVIWSIAVVLLVLACSASSQVLHSYGRDFWLAFPEVEQGGKPELTLYIAAVTKGPDIRLSLSLGNGAMQQMTIPAGVMGRIDVDSLFGDTVACGVVLTSRKAIHLLADQNIVVAGSAVEGAFGEAFTALPVQALGNSYMVLGVPTRLADGRTHFCVVATEDWTRVRISPVVPINGRLDTTSFAVDLNRGEVFLGYCNGGSTGGNDISGTTIVANKPIAVISGSTRSTFGRDDEPRHHRSGLLLEQLLPVDFFESRVLIAPQFPPGIGPEKGIDTGFVRFVSSSSGSVWSASGIGSGTLTRGVPVDIPVAVDTGIDLQSRAPIASMKYISDVGFSKGDSTGPVGGVSSLIIPAVRQFDTAYTFVVPSDTGVFYSEADVIFSSAEKHMLLDGQSPKLAFGHLPRQIPGTTYSVAHINLSPGRHHIQADSAFGLQICSFGDDMTMAYPGGFRFDKPGFDAYPPTVSIDSHCGAVVLSVADSNMGDGGLDSVLISAGTSNIAFESIDVPPAKRFAKFNASLINPYNDGVVTIKAIDIKGRSSEAVLKVPGFTVGENHLLEQGSVWTDSLTVYPGASYCRDIVLVNYGFFPQVVTHITSSMAPALFSASSSFPITLLPGESRVVTVCYSGAVSAPMLDTVVIGDSCISRSVAIFSLSSPSDTTAAVYTSSADRCSEVVSITLADNMMPAASGIARILPTRLVNCILYPVPSGLRFPIDSLTLFVQRLNLDSDMMFDIAVYDGAGNVANVVDTILALVPHIASVDVVDTSLADGGAVVLFGGEEKEPCRNIDVINMTREDLRITRFSLAHGMHFSVPPSQIPMLIPPFQKRSLVICLDNDGGMITDDVLTLYTDCSVHRNILLKSSDSHSPLIGYDDCGTVVQATAGATHRTFVKAVVTATPGKIALLIGLTHDDEINLDIYDAQGQHVVSGARGLLLRAGIHQMGIDLDENSSGMYFVRLITRWSGENTSDKFIHVK